MKETGIKKQTRELLLEKGAELFHKQGFHHTGLNDILDAAGVPKGSFYFYFKSKEDFGLHVIDYFMDRYLAVADNHVANDRVPYLERFRNFLNEFLTFFEENNYTGGCPIGNFSLEMSDLNENFRKKLIESFEKMRQKVLLFLEPAQKNGELPLAGDIGETADFIVNSWEGALMRVKVTRSRAPMMLFYKIVFDNLLKKTGNGSQSPTRSTTDDKKFKHDKEEAQ